jgi:hypothetical protein
MRLWIVSDQHTELTRGWDLPSPNARPDFDVMVVAGDLITRAERGVRWLLERVTDRPVIYVPGNHEFYGVDIDLTVEKARGCRPNAVGRTCTSFASPRPTASGSLRAVRPRDGLLRRRRPPLPRNRGGLR